MKSIFKKDFSSICHLMIFFLNHVSKLHIRLNTTYIKDRLFDFIQFPCSIYFT